MIALTLMEFSLINKITRGHFTYTLDDAYIHLAMAENIYQGHYGINLSEASSPSSNVLWPFLLVPTIMTGLGHLFPLFLNIFFCSITVRTGETSRVLQGSDGKWYIIRRGDNRKELNVPFESIGNALVFRIRYGKKSPALVRMERLSEKIRQILASASPDQGGELNSTDFLAYRRNRPYLQGLDRDSDKSQIHGRPRQDMTLSAALEGAVDSQDSRDQNALLRQYRIRKALIDEALRRNIQAEENSTESYARAAANFLCVSLLEDEFGKDFSSDPLNPASSGKASEFLKKLRESASLKMDREVFQDLVRGLDKFRRD